MFDVDYPAGDISVNDIEGEVEGFRAEAEVKWISTRKSTRQGRICHFISGCWSIEVVEDIVKR